MIIYVLTTQIFCILLILFSIFGLFIFIAFLSYILHQILLLHISDLPFYIVTDLLHLITKLRLGLDLYLSGQAILTLYQKHLLIQLYIQLIISYDKLKDTLL